MVHWQCGGGHAALKSWSGVKPAATGHEILRSNLRIRRVTPFCQRKLKIIISDSLHSTRAFAGAFGLTRVMMRAMPEQNYSNHVRRVPVFGVTLLLLLLTVVGAIVNLYQSWGDHQRLYSASLILVLSACVLVVAVSAREYPLKTQDRAIRAEENLRHYVLTGKLLDPRLAPKQIVALRFASDEEFTDLARHAAEKGLPPDAIKRAILKWRPDTYRV